MKRLQGEDATIPDGLALARQHIGKIFVWAVITATVGHDHPDAPGALRDHRADPARASSGSRGRVLTYFVVPVLLFEDRSAWATSIKRSARSSASAGVSSSSGNATIGLAIFLLGDPGRASSAR